MPQKLTNDAVADVCKDENVGSSDEMDCSCGDGAITWNLAIATKMPPSIQENVQSNEINLCPIS